MTIKIRFHGDKAIIRWKHPGEAQFLKQQLTMFRDSMSQKVPISVKDEKGREVPKLLMPRVMSTPDSGGSVTKPVTIVAAPTPAPSGATVTIPPQPLPQSTPTEMNEDTQKEIRTIAENIAIGEAADKIMEMIEKKPKEVSPSSTPSS